MPENQNQKLDTIIQMLTQVQRALGRLSVDVEAIRKGATPQKNKSPEQPQAPRRQL